MPTLAEGVESATIARWLKSDGERVEVGDELVELETDKVTVVHEAEDSGVLRILVPEGASAGVGDVIAQLDANSTEGTPTPVPAPHVQEDVHHPVAAPAPVAAASVPTGVRATPLARLIARERGIDLAGVAGTGPRGLVRRADVAPDHASRAEPAAAVPPSPEVRIEKLSRVQEVIARRMTEAKAAIPHFQVETEAEVDRLLRLRTELAELEGSPTPSLNDFVLKAAALALREHPRANASYRETHFELHARVNVGFAVATDSALVVPTIFDADRRSLLEIAVEARRLAERVRSGTFTLEDVADGTFTVSNLGMFGMTAITPIVNVPQAAILGVGNVRDVPRINADGAVLARHLMTLTLSCDHRILYGAGAARFLARIRDLLEQPLGLVVAS